MSENNTQNFQLCWNCKNATNRFACPWVEDFSLVDGWVVKKSKRRYNLNDYESFEIIECPLFERG